MRRRNVGQFILVIVSGLTLSGGLAHSEQLMPLDPVPAAYADKHMPAGWWTDPTIIEEGRKIYVGEAHPLVSCTGCHGDDGEPVRSGQGVRSLKSTRRFSDSYWFWRVAEGIPKTPMAPWKSLLSEDQIWQVVAFMHTFSHGGKPAEHTDYTGTDDRRRSSPRMWRRWSSCPRENLQWAATKAVTMQSPSTRSFSMPILSMSTK